jgi:hypothetical protein
MKKTAFAVIVSLICLIGCFKDKNNNCACDGSYGTNFSQLSADFDSLCSNWKSSMCPKTWTCTCTMNAPTTAFENTDSLTAASKCAFYQTQMQLQYVYNGVKCSL